MDAIADSMVAMIAVVVALSAAIGQFAGPIQTELTQAIIDAFAVPSPYRRLLNFGVGITIGIALAVVFAVWADAWILVPAIILAGVKSSVEASKVHDQGKAFDDGVQTGMAMRPPRRLVSRPEGRAERRVV